MGALTRLAKSTALPLVGLTLLGPVGATSAVAQDLTPLNLRLAFVAGGVDAPMFVADCKGYFAEEGLDVEIVDGSGSTSTIQAVGNGSFRLGNASLATLAQAAANSGNHDLIAIFGLLQKDPTSIISLEGSGIAEPKDIEGKRFATEAGNLSDGMITAFAEANGVDMDTVDIIITDNYKQALLRGDADFINSWASPDGDQIRRFVEIEPPMLFANHGVNLLGSSVIVRKDWLMEHEEEARSYLRALTQAHADVLADPEGALDCFMQHRPDASAEAIALEIEVLEQYRHTERTEGEPFGYVHPEDIVQTISLIEQYGGIPVGVVTPESIYTDAYQPARE